MVWRDAETGRGILAGWLDEMDRGMVGHVDVVEALGNRGGCGDVGFTKMGIWLGRDGRVVEWKKRGEDYLSVHMGVRGGRSRSGEGRSRVNVGKSKSGRWGGGGGGEGR